MGDLQSRGPGWGGEGARGLGRPQPCVPSALSAPLPGLYNYYDDEKEKLQIVEMPLAHKLSSLIILMPHHVEPLERLEKLLTKEKLKIWMGKMQKKAVAISLPKGVVEVTHDLQVRDGPTWGLQGLEERGAWGTHSSAQPVCPEPSVGVQVVLGAAAGRGLGPAFGNIMVTSVVKCDRAPAVCQTVFRALRRS